MTDHSAPQFVDENHVPTVLPRPVSAPPRTTAAPSGRLGARLGEATQARSFWATLDYPLLLIIGLLLATGAIMVYSATFDWGFQDFGEGTYILSRHLRNMAIGAVLLIGLTVIDYRLWRRFAVWFLLITISFLIGVLIFGDDTFGARRALIAGSYQPSELAELIVVLYLAAWMSSKDAKIHSLFYGMIPFGVLVGLVSGLIMLQPDLSTAFIVLASASIMFFLAGADLRQLIVVVVVAGLAGLYMAQNLPYAQERVQSYFSGFADPTRASYHVQQSVNAFVHGGWFGVGLGQGIQKFGALPAPHTDSIFAIIGEELGILGASGVIALYVAFVVRGFQIARRASDAFGALLAAGITGWVVTQALLNIAVMTNVVPPTGVPLPFISYGGSSLTVLMAGVGLLLSIRRRSLLQGQQTTAA
jgi:cell division protein FtsW